MPRGDESSHVCRRASGCEKSAGPRRQACPLANPFEYHHLYFIGARRDRPYAGVEVETGRDPVPEERWERGRARDVRHESRVRLPRMKWKYMFAQRVDYRVERRRLQGGWLEESG